MAELLIELLSEEVPARMQERAAAQLAEAATARLKAASLSFERVASYVTPRRLVLVVDGLPAAQPDLKEERKGPRVGAPDQGALLEEIPLPVAPEPEEEAPSATEAG